MTNPTELSFKRLLEHAPIGIVIHRWDTSVVYANPTALKLLRLSYNQIIGKDAYDAQWNFLDESGRCLSIDEYPVNKVKHTQNRLMNEVLGVVDSASASISWFLVNAYFEGENEDEEKDEGGFIVVTFNDISDVKKHFSFQDIVENTQDIVIVTDARDISYPSGPKIVYVNQAFEELSGYKAAEVIGETPRILQGALTDPEAKQRIHQALQNKVPVNETVLNYDINGRPYWVEMNIIPLRNKYNEVTHFAAIERDVSERKFHLEQLKTRNEDLRVLKRDLERLVDQRTAELLEAKATLEKIAFFDPLTNLPNRRFFLDQASKLIKAGNRRGFKLAFGLLDIDSFKAFNDNHGHETGDRVLQALGTFLADFFRSDDAYCRYGGEEFAFAVVVDNRACAESLSTRLVNGIEQQRFECGLGNPVTLTVSMGVYIESPDAQSTLEHAIKHADEALYNAKDSGKNTFVIAEHSAVA
ncbi:MAG: diguanylate cyclase [Oleiphilaceae bacterium]|nr:diguanylate cyclase [Oleiphilaceae bacterium]